MTGDICDFKFSLVGKMCSCQETEKNQVICDFPDTSDQSVNPESGAGVKSTSVFWGKLQSFFFQEKVQNQLSQHMNAFKPFLHLKVPTSMKMVVLLRMMYKTSQ